MRHENAPGWGRHTDLKRVALSSRRTLNVCAHACQPACLPTGGADLHDPLRDSTFAGRDAAYARAQAGPAAGVGHNTRQRLPAAHVCPSGHPVVEGAHAHVACLVRARRQRRVSRRRCNCWRHLCSATGLRARHRPSRHSSRRPAEHQCPRPGGAAGCRWRRAAAGSSEEAHVGGGRSQGAPQRPGLPARLDVAGADVFAGWVMRV
eukprot:364965-Chlamydomonas_euryale.AAC.35